MSEARCGICRKTYDLGPAVGELFIYYPQGETLYWKHCRESEDHRRVVAAMDASNTELLARLPDILKERRKERDRKRRLEKKEPQLVQMDAGLVLQEAGQDAEAA